MRVLKRRMLRRRVLRRMVLRRRLRRSAEWEGADEYGSEAGAKEDTDTDEGCLELGKKFSQQLKNVKYLKCLKLSEC